MMNNTVDASAFIGSWRLQSWVISNSADDRQSEPFGANPNGLIQYTANGWMSAAVCRSERERFGDKVPLRKQNERALAEAYKSYFHYCGPYRIDGNTIIHSVVMSLNPNMVGTDQHRRFEFSSDQLILRGEEPAGKVTRYHKLVWRRAPQQQIINQTP